MKQEDYLIAMASKLIAMASKLIAMASKVRGFNPSTTRSAPNATAARAPDDSPWETITDGRRNVVHDWIDGRWNDVKAASRGASTASLLVESSQTEHVDAMLQQIREAVGETVRQERVG